MAIRQVLTLGALDPGGERDAAEEVEGVLGACGLGEHASGAGAQRQLLPAGVEVREVQRVGRRGGDGRVRTFGAAGDDDLTADERAGGVSQRTREERKRPDLEFALL